MYLSDLRVYFIEEVYFRVTWSGWRSTKITEKLVDYANPANVEFIVDPRVSFRGWLIYSYLHLSWSSHCQGSVQIGSLTTLWHDHIAFIDDTACPGKKNSIFINDHALNREPVPLTMNIHFFNIIAPVHDTSVVSTHPRLWMRETIRKVIFLTVNSKEALESFPADHRSVGTFQ